MVQMQVPEKRDQWWSEQIYTPGVMVVLVLVAVAEDGKRAGARISERMVTAVWKERLRRGRGIVLAGDSRQVVISCTSYFFVFCEESIFNVENEGREREETLRGNTNPSSSRACTSIVETKLCSYQ